MNEIDECTSFKSGFKRYVECYGLPNRNNLAQFLGMEERSVYDDIELPNFGMSMYKYWKKKNGAK